MYATSAQHTLPLQAVIAQWGEDVCLIEYINNVFHSQIIYICESLKIKWVYNNIKGLLVESCICVCSKIFRWYNKYTFVII